MSEPKKVIQKEAKMFYAMIGMIKCAAEYNASLCRDKAVHETLLSILAGFRNSTNMFIGKMLADLPEADRKAWHADWKRDYMSMASIFEHWSEMNDEKRSLLEQFSADLAAGNVRENTEIDFLPLDKAELIEGKQYLLITERKKVMLASCGVAGSLWDGKMLLNNKAFLAVKPFDIEDILNAANIEV